MSNALTVLMTVYNGMPYLCEAVESTLKQTYKDFEFLIIDDASTDNSLDYLKSLKDERIRLIKNKNNIGQVMSLNKGIDIAAGEYIARLDQDDVNLPKRFEEQIKYFINNPNIALLCSYEHTINSKGVLILDWKKHIKNYGHFIGEIILGLCPVWHPSAMYKKAVVQQLGGYDVQFGPSEDYNLWAKFALGRYEAAIVPKFHLLQREHDNRQSILFNDKQIKANSVTHQNVINYFCSGNSLNCCTSSFLMLKNDPCGNGFNGIHLKEIIKSAIELFHNIEKTKNLSVSEKKYLMKTIRNRLGYGIEIGYYFIFLPNFLFTILFFILSPVYFYKMRNFFAIIYRKIKELKYFKNSLMSN